MTWIAVVLVGFVALVALGASAWLLMQNRALSAAAATERERAAHLVREYNELQASAQRLHDKAESTRAEVATVTGQRDAAGRELERLQREISRRPVFRQQSYKIVVIGLPKTGKTSLTLKWANPLWEQRNVQGTSFDQYTRTVSSVVSPRANLLVNHVFEIYDYGGEQIVDAHDTLVMDDIHGLLVVVDLGDGQGLDVDPARIRAQIQEFNPNALRFFFRSPRVTKTCRTVALFINKSDLIPGRPAEVEAAARALFKPLIDGLQEFADNVEIEVIVGSAVSGHNAHLIMPHFIRKLLPTDAYDDQLLQEQRSAVRDGPEGRA